MANVAILVGNVNYVREEDRLECCADDVRAMQELITATQKYEKICALTDVDSDKFREEILQALSGHDTIEEIFFYFTGHGHYDGREFFHCATNFDGERPNETGLSNTDLHTILKGANPELVVKVIDACYSGSVLIKSPANFAHSENFFKNFIQFASSLNNQHSFTGDPLSAYTEKFIAAALKKEKGAILYDDIKNTIRDDFRGNDQQVPFFTEAHTGRETFVDNASILDGLRAKKNTETAMGEPADNTAPRPIEILQKVEESLASKQASQAFVTRLADKMQTKAETNQFDQLFTAQVIKYSGFYEQAPNKFMIIILSKEQRRDNFVLVSPKKNTVRQNIYQAINALPSSFVDYEDRYDIKLNCSLDDLQIKIIMTPKYSVE